MIFNWFSYTLDKQKWANCMGGPAKIKFSFNLSLWGHFQKETIHPPQRYLWRVVFALGLKHKNPFLSLWDPQKKKSTTLWVNCMGGVATIKFSYCSLSSVFVNGYWNDFWIWLEAIIGSNWPSEATSKTSVINYANEEGPGQINHLPLFPREKFQFGAPVWEVNRESFTGWWYP